MAASASLKKAQTQQQPPKPKRRKHHEETTIISTSADAAAAISSTSPPRPPDSDTPVMAMDSAPGPIYPTYLPPSAYPSSYTKFNSALNAGLLNPMSPPPAPLAVLDKTRSSPTLFDMMANEQDYHPRSNQIVPNPNPNSIVSGRGSGPLSSQDRQLLLQERVAELLSCSSPGDHFNDQDSADVRLTLTSKDGMAISLNVHRQILVANSRFFAAKLNDRWSKQQRSLPHLVDISDCDDVEVYIETLRLMYCKDLRRRLMRVDVSRVLGILKVAAAIAFDAGVLSCLEYLEAAPWAEDEEEKVAAVLSQLRLENPGAAGEVLKRVSLEVGHLEEEEANGGNGGDSNREEILARLLQVVLEGKDEKARREMKGLVSKMLRENNNGNSSSARGDLSKESLYSACNGCLQLLRHHFIRAANSDAAEAAQISRQADNLHWLLDILIDRQIADEFLHIWAAQTELSAIHCKVPAVHRYEVSRVTARLFVGIGEGQVLVSKETRCLLLRTWLEPFYEDFGWMRRVCKGLDRHSIEEGLGNTILTLPLGTQQEILLAWFDRFLNSGDDCPNIQRAFQVWWRRAFWRRRNSEGERPTPLRIAAACEESC